MEVLRRIGIPPGTYIWKGGVHTAPDPKAGHAWCFAIGENEWIDGKIWSKEKEKSDLLAPPPIQPIGRINCISGENQ